METPLYDRLKPKLVGVVDALDGFVARAENYVRRNVRDIGVAAAITLASVGTSYGLGSAADFERLRDMKEYGAFCDTRCESIKEDALNNEEGKNGALAGLIFGLYLAGIYLSEKN